MSRGRVPLHTQCPIFAHREAGVSQDKDASLATECEILLLAREQGLCGTGRLARGERVIHSQSSQSQRACALANELARLTGLQDCRGPVAVQEARDDARLTPDGQAEAHGSRLQRGAT